MAMAYYQTRFNYSRFVRYDSSAITVHRFSPVRPRISRMRSDLLAPPDKNKNLVKTGNKIQTDLGKSNRSTIQKPQESVQFNVPE